MKHIVKIFSIIVASVILLSSCSKGKLVGTLLVHFNRPVKEEVTVYIYPYVSANPEKQSYTIDKITLKMKESDAEFILNAGDYYMKTSKGHSRGVQVHVGKVTKVTIGDSE